MIELNPLFKQALKLMEETNENIFITGRAGTGKSTLLDYFRSTTKKNIVVLAPTGVAAVNVSGQTVHSFFGFKPGVTVEQARKKAKKKTSAVYKKLDAIVIDEVSMVRADLLDCVDQFLRINGKISGVPFGSTQMIFIGDLYQIPPVVIGHERETFRSYYKSEHFFDAKVFNDVDVKYLELEKIYRQTDEKFIELLNKIRNKTVDDKDVEMINKRYFEDEDNLPGDAICLTTTNAMADERNKAELARLRGKPRAFEAEIEGKFDEKHFPAEKVLKLKKRAQVMLLNNDPVGRWVNGTIATVNELKNDYLSVELPDGSIEELAPFKWSIYNFSWNKGTHSVDAETIGTFKQYPVKLAWAITIHKSQGKTFDDVVIDIGRGTFTPGQLYVAISRCRSFDGIFLKKKIKKSNIWTDWRVVKFVTEYQYGLSEKRISIDEKIGLIKRAIDDGSFLEIIYLRAKGEKSKRIIKPESVGEMEYKGKNFTGTWAYCLKRKDCRSFRVDRILEIKEISLDNAPLGEVGCLNPKDLKF